jgi:hypothetical protein
LLLVNAICAPPADATPFKVTVTVEDVPAAIDVEASVRFATAVAMLGFGEPVELPLPPLVPPVAVPGLVEDPEAVELPLPPLVPPAAAEAPLFAGEAENDPFAPVPQPIRADTTKSVATATASEHVCEFNLDNFE